MSAPLVWIGLPAIFAGLLFVLRPGKRISALVGTGMALGLSVLALWMPPESSFTLGRWVITLRSTFSVLGRQLVLGPQDKWLLVLLYVMLAIWLGGSHLAGVAWNLPVLGLAMVSLLIAALAVEPFLYAAIFIQMAVLLSIPLLIPRGKRPGLGSLRYLIFQTLGTPFILISGWMLGSGEIASTDVVFIHRVLGSLGLGFVMLLGVFPFHTWIPLLMEEIHPYVAGFLVWLLPLAVSLFGLGFFERYTWLRQSGMVYVFLQLSGLLMTLVGGISAAFETRLGRIFGNLVLVETGLMLLALSLGPDSGWRLYALMVFPRTLAYAVWSLAATQARNAGVKEIRHLQGVLLQNPWVGGGLVLAGFSLSGFPVLAGFPVRLSLFTHLARSAPAVAIGAFVGSAGVLAAVLRLLAALVHRADASHIAWSNYGKRMTWLLLGMGGFLLVVTGLFPQWILPLWVNMIQSFPHLL